MNNEGLCTSCGRRIGPDTLTLHGSMEKDLWIGVYKSVTDGLFKHGSWIGVENSIAKEKADRAVMDYREVNKQ